MKEKVKRRTITAALPLSAMLAASVLFSGCGKDEPKRAENTATSDSAEKKATQSSAASTSNTPAAVTEKAGESAKEPDPDAEKTEPTVTPTYEEAWKYHIVQSGYYNAAAKWDEDGNLLEEPSYTPGEYIYYNDCDEYYDNFVSKNNVFMNASLSLDDINAHSSDNSMKVTGRSQTSIGFSGFGLKLDADNVLDISKLMGKEVTLGFWVYYTDDFANGLADTMTFAVWSNLNPEYDRENEVITPEPEYIEYSEDMEPEAWENAQALNRKTEVKYNYRRMEENAANNQGFYKLSETVVPYETWKYIEVTTTINTEALVPMFAVATLGEDNSSNVTFYNPFYIDDITLTLNN